MNKDEYIIINKSVFDKRVEELRKTVGKYAILEAKKDLYFKIDNLLSQSTPLIPVLEDAFDVGAESRRDNIGKRTIDSVIQDKQEYISNLKLDI